jgi:hypothetical protein
MFSKYVELNIGLLGKPPILVCAESSSLRLFFSMFCHHQGIAIGTCSFFLFPTVGDPIRLCGCESPPKIKETLLLLDEKSLICISYKDKETERGSEWSNTVSFRLETNEQIRNLAFDCTHIVGCTPVIMPSDTQLLLPHMRQLPFPNVLLPIIIEYVGNQVKIHWTVKDVDDAPSLQDLPIHCRLASGSPQPNAPITRWITSCHETDFFPVAETEYQKSGDRHTITLSYNVPSHVYLRWTASPFLTLPTLPQSKNQHWNFPGPILEFICR